MPKRTLKSLQPAAVALVFAAAVAVAAVRSTPADAVPSFAQQTGQPCEECHIGAFGPQLKPYGRDFKLFGYQNTDKKSHELPIAATVQTSVTHTGADQNPPPEGFAPNNNFAVDQVSLYYAGRAPMGWGAFAQVTYDGVAHGFNLDNFDVRHVSEFDFLGKDTLAAVDINNSPTVEDPWNSTPSWGFPYNGSELAPGPSAATLMDGGLAGLVVGTGGYLLWNNTVYIDATAYAPLERNFAGRLGEGTDGSSDRFAGAIPYVRVALLHDLDQQQTQAFELGAYALRASRYPGGDVSAGTDTLSDWAIDANYQYIGDAKNEVSVHATYIHEDQDLKASSVLLGTQPTNRLATARADVSYSYHDTWTPSFQVFTTTGTPDPVQYGGGVRTSGYIAELAYTPWGKAGSPFYWLNVRTAVQYQHYAEFDGDHSHAQDNDALYFSAWLALAPLGWKVQR